MKNIANVGKACVGCGSCSISCPKQCISMEYDENGFIRPRVDRILCVGCGVCVNHCLVTYPVERLYQFTNTKYYCAISGHTDLVKKSSSGGLFALFANSVIKKGGYVCGCVYDHNMKLAKHIVANKMDDVMKMCGSKYVQSNAFDCFSKIKELLSNDKEVLFTGTACQVAGLKLYLGKEYSTLFLVEILCHGVPSPQLFYDFVSYLEAKVNGTITNIQFRDKSKDGWGSEHRTSITYLDRNNNAKKKFLLLPAYFSAFFYGLSLRESCYECKFARIERVSDITIGDFWGAWKKYKKPFYEGISVAAVNTERGELLMERIQPELSFLENLSIDEAIYSNDNFEHPVKLPSERKAFYDYYRENGYKGIWKITYTTKTYRKKTIVSFYGALIPKKVQKHIQHFRRGGVN